MVLEILSKQILNEDRYPFRSPNPADTVDTIIKGLKEIENSIDSTAVNSEVTSLSTGGTFFKKNQRPCLHIQLRETKTAALKLFGCVIMPVEFGNLVYLCKYEYLKGNEFGWYSTKNEQLKKIKESLDTIDKWMEYTFIQTLGDFVFIEMLRKYDPNFDKNITAFNRFLTEK